MIVSNNAKLIANSNAKKLEHLTLDTSYIHNIYITLHYYMCLKYISIKIKSYSAKC